MPCTLPLGQRRAYIISKFGWHNVNDVQWEGLPSNSFERRFTAGERLLNYLETST